MSAIYIKDKDKGLAGKLSDIRDYLIQTRPPELSLKDLKKLETKYYVTTTITYLINNAHNGINE